jgi:hypothetical protein
MAEGRHSFVAFYPSDWVGGTARMTRTHRSVYFDVCCYIWDKAEPCPASELPLMLGDLPNWRDLLQDLVDARKLFREEDGSVTNPKAMEEASKALDLWERKSAGGRRGAAATNATEGSPTERARTRGRARPARAHGADLFRGSADGTVDGSPVGSADGSSPKTAGSPDAEPEPELEEETQPDPPSRPVRAPAREGGRLDDRDLKALYDAVCDASGFATASPAAIDRGMRQVEQWRDDGLDFQEVVLPTIRSVVAESREPTRVLGRFDKAVRHENARRAASGRGGRPYVPPASPDTRPDGEDPAFHRLRDALLADAGPAAYSATFNQVRLVARTVGAGDEPAVELTGSGFATQRARDDPRLERHARALGLGRVL